MPRSVQASVAPAYSAGGQDVLYNTSGYPPQSQASASSYYQQSGYGTATPPAMSNPYAAPPAAARGFGRNGMFDPEEEARIAEWHSAYTPKDDASNKKTGQSAVRSNPTVGDSSAPDTTDDNNRGTGKQKTVVRQGGGKTWEDPSLLEWDPSHPRLFIGNLAGEVTDESLLKAFAKYPSVSKARVIRDKHSTKSKSYGFVSFVDTDDYFRAAKEMQGKYIGSHPVIVRRANTEIQATTKKDHGHGKGKHNNNKAKGGIASQLLAASNLNNASNRVQKPGHKGKHSGPKMLG